MLVLLQVRGTPEENLPLTHVAQTDIWQHQFPAHGCAGDDTKFLISWWDSPEYHGIGSHIHLMTGLLGLAMTHGRVLTLLNWTYTRAKHSGCASE